MAKYRDAMNQVALAVGFSAKDGKPTLEEVVDRVKALSDEAAARARAAKAAKAEAAAKAERTAKAEAAAKTPLDFDWSERLRHALTKCKSSFATMSRQLPPETGLAIGQQFIGDGAANMCIVGFLPAKPTFSVCAVASWKVCDPSWLITPECLHGYRIDFVVERACGQEQHVALCETRARRLAPSYGIWPEAIERGFDIAIRDKRRRVRVVDLAESKRQKLPITIVEDEGSAEPGKKWRISTESFHTVKREV